MLIELKKLKRSSVFISVIVGGLLASSVPLLQFSIHPKETSNPMTYLFGNSWMMIAMINTILLIIVSCCIYHIENENGAINHLETLPINLMKVYISKLGILIICLIIIYLIETSSIFIILHQYFPNYQLSLLELLSKLAYSFLLTLPVTTFMLWISSICKNMWVTLGIGITGIFLAQIVGSTNFANYIPFSLVYQLALHPASYSERLIVISMIESILFIVIGAIWAHIRRHYQ